ncbi:MAG: hypothetical protein MPW14_04410 [Candidatus Manganitrophus sp.]|nr:hypothetical protein [Candidatus Manganitrophus sp.]MDC4223276.1 hypothetical protein [Candidatus Manganitrophus sp.]WDT71622.1 MAG: hypothetical protein MPW17_01885 [Candidatus Manganitrophus sp.]WDT76128.1 MAG: hypothetical protein MPW16_02620 [Candidatus Manganitrophus sp.]WDT81030.1 MAG: hypothetical protein MPW14_04410 [Candidatus Manganitrophus sp.]
MTWKKLGRVYVADGRAKWTYSHAYIPTALLVNDDRIRVYVAFLDRDKVGRVGYVDVDAKNPLRVLRVSKSPVLDVGRPGTFDDHGVTPICIIPDQDCFYLYYVGWQLSEEFRYRLFLGLAISNDEGETFNRYDSNPVLSPSEQERSIRSAAHVLRDEGSWKMWYAGGGEWIDLEGKRVPTYQLRYLESDALMKWGDVGRICMEFENNDEFGFGRPFVIKEEGLYRMWYSIRTRSKGYRLGYAESNDGINWLRKDGEVGIDVSSDGWDSEMICFASIQKTRYGTYMFYNGNNYGETGFGVALLSSS